MTTINTTYTSDTALYYRHTAELVLQVSDLQHHNSNNRILHKPHENLDYQRVIHEITQIQPIMGKNDLCVWRSNLIRKHLALYRRQTSILLCFVNWQYWKFIGIKIKNTQLLLNISNELEIPCHVFQSILKQMIKICIY